MWQPIKLPYTSLPGLSSELIQDHYQLYLDYLRRLDKLPRPRGDIQNPFQAARLAEEEGFLRNAARLHELYFENIIPNGSGDPQDLLGIRTDSILTDMHDLALGSTGWVILAGNPQQKEFQLVVMPSHGAGFTVDSVPLLVLDCYEHAYMPQYGIDKEAYLEAFFRNVCWTTVGSRVPLVE